MQQCAGQHSLEWRQRENPGQIQCRRCGKTWPWDNGHNMQCAPCPPHTPIEIPDGWLSMHYASSNQDAAVQFLTDLTINSNSTRSGAASMMVSTESAGSQTVSPGSSNIPSSSARPPVRIRLRRKTTVPSASNPSSSSSTRTALTVFPASSSRPVVPNVADDFDETSFDLEPVSLAHFDGMG